MGKLSLSVPNKPILYAEVNLAHLDFKSTTTLKDIFARFLMMEVEDGAASTDTIRNYLFQTKQYLS